MARTRQRSMLLAVAVAVLWWSIPPSPATASTSPTSVSVSAGSLGTTAPAVTDFSVVVLDGTTKSTHARLQPFSVTDARGSGEGWKLTVQVSPFRQWDAGAYVPDGHELEAGSLTLAGLSVRPEGTDSSPPSLAPGPYTLDGPAVLVAAAAAGTGMGTFAFDPSSELVVTVPAHAYAATYRSELSVSVTSGP